jgi:hypothetical protein
MLKDIELHEKYIVDEAGNRTEVVIEVSQFARLVKALEESEANLQEMHAKVQELLEEMDDLRAFDEAMKATGEDAELIPFEQATAEIEIERFKG